MLAFSAVDRGFEPWLGGTNDYENGLCCFSAKHKTIRNENKGWLAGNQNNVLQWSEMFTHGLLFR